MNLKAHAVGLPAPFSASAIDQLALASSSDRARAMGAAERQEEAYWSAGVGGGGPVVVLRAGVAAVIGLSTGLLRAPRAGIGGSLSLLSNAPRGAHTLSFTHARP